jgi:hypothetical protein
LLRKIVDARARGARAVALADPAVGAAVGARAPKTDGAPKVTGSERYGADRWPDGALWLRGPVAHAKARFEMEILRSFAKHPLADVSPRATCR